MTPIDIENIDAAILKQKMSKAAASLDQRIELKKANAMRILAAHCARDEET